MDTAAIIEELEAERDRLNRAIAALKGGIIPRRKDYTAARPLGRKRRRRLSAAARKRISDAMKKKWAARKEEEA